MRNALLFALLVAAAPAVADVTIIPIPGCNCGGERGPPPGVFCETDAECLPAEPHCDKALAPTNFGHCRQCITHEHCASGRRCLDHYCVAPDAGASTADGAKDVAPFIALSLATLVVFVMPRRRRS